LAIATQIEGASGTSGTSGTSIGTWGTSGTSGTASVRYCLAVIRCSLILLVHGSVNIRNSWTCQTKFLRCRTEYVWCVCNTNIAKQ